MITERQISHLKAIQNFLSSISTDDNKSWEKMVLKNLNFHGDIQYTPCSIAELDSHWLMCGDPGRTTSQMMYLWEQRALW